MQLNLFQITESLATEKTEKDQLQKTNDQLEAKIAELEAKIQALLDENGLLKLQLAT